MKCMWSRRSRRREYRGLPLVPAGQNPGGPWLLFSYLAEAEKLAAIYEENFRILSAAQEDNKPVLDVNPTKYPSKFSKGFGEELFGKHATGSTVHWGNDGFCVDVAATSSAAAGGCDDRRAVRREPLRAGGGPRRVGSISHHDPGEPELEAASALDATVFPRWTRERGRDSWRGEAVCGQRRRKGRDSCDAGGQCNPPANLITCAVRTILARVVAIFLTTRKISRDSDDENRSCIMSIVSLILAVICAASCACRAQAQDVTPSFDLPDGFFPILSWDLPHWSAKPFSDDVHGVSSLEKCGFNVAAFVRPQHLAEVKKRGLKCILAAQDFPIPWRKLSDQQIEEIVKKLVDETGGSDEVMGYFLADEPGVGDFPALGKAVAAVKKFTAGQLPKLHQPVSGLRRLVAADLSQLGTAELHRISREIRRIGEAAVHQLRQLSDYIFAGYKRCAAGRGLFHEHAGSAAGGDEAWCYAILEYRLNRISWCQPRRSVAGESAASRLAYTTLAGGAKGLTWYTYYAICYLYAPIDRAGNHTATWSALNMVNEQMKVLGPDSADH